MAFAVAKQIDVVGHVRRAKYNDLAKQVSALRPGQCVLVPMVDGEIPQERQGRTLRASLRARGIPVSVMRATDGHHWAISKV